jgi:hypothetical protein
MIKKENIEIKKHFDQLDPINHCCCWVLMRLLILALGFMMGRYFLSLELSTFEFSKCSMRLLSPCSRAYVNMQIYFLCKKYLFTLELAPPLIMKLNIKVPQICCGDKVDKPVPHIAVVLHF